MEKRAWVLPFLGAIGAWMLNIINVWLHLNEWLKQHLPWSLIPFIVLLVVGIAWFILGNKIFNPTFYRLYRVTRVNEIEAPDILPDLSTKTLSKSHEGKILEIKSKVVKKKERKKRFEL